MVHADGGQCALQVVLLRLDVVDLMPADQGDAQPLSRALCCFSMWAAHPLVEAQVQAIAVGVVESGQPDRALGRRVVREILDIGQT